MKTTKKGEGENGVWVVFHPHICRLCEGIFECLGADCKDFVFHKYCPDCVVKFDIIPDPTEETKEQS